ncbi:hypothetical protein [Streptomyces sp. NPDC101237]|uniref:hypothetical protein n=1 Tax=Streptomyces sp. NPDC101237 TaxID=3366139 RepID=UPI00380B8C2F
MRSSGHRAHPVKATVTWHISRQGSEGAGGDRPDETCGPAQDLPLQAVQAVNR